MAFEENGGSGMVMPVAPAYAGGGFGGGFGGDWSWVLLLILLCGGGWGNGFGGGFDGGIYPWLNNSQNINGGFRDQMLNSSISGIQSGVTSGFGDVATQLCGGFAGVNATINGAQMADLERSFAAQTANTQALSALQAQLAQCCCDNRLATCQTQNIVQSEGASTRLAIQNQTQQILDKMCQQEIDALKDRNAELRTQVSMQNLAASQAAQTSRILADNAAQTVALEQYLNPVPVPAYVVSNPNCCSQNFGGCGCGG